MQCHLLERSETRVGTMMVHKTGASSSHTHILVRKTPKHGVNARLTRLGQGVLRFHNDTPIVCSQLDDQCLQLIGRVTFITHQVASFPVATRFTASA